MRALRILLASCLVTAAGVGTAQDQPARICDAEPHRQFDFWVGKWTVRTPDGKTAGVNTITLEERGCVVVERWRSANGGTGQSLNYFDPVVGKWKQRWVGVGIILEMEGGFRNGAMVLEGPLHYVQQKRTTILRGTWTPSPEGGLRQHFEESADKGKTWTTWFDGRYSRFE